MPPIVAPYGCWKSPISSDMVSATTIYRTNLMLDSHPDFSNSVYWLEIRTNQNGRSVVCSNTLGENAVHEWTPVRFNVRSRVHEYGGGAFFVYEGTVYFSNFADQRLYKQKSSTSTPVPITPDLKWMYADGRLSHQTKKIYMVRESHENIANPQFSVNTVICLDPLTGIQNILAEGSDFYSHPRVSADGTKICWIQWNHPNMPWDDTELWVAKLNDTRDGLLDGSATKVVSGACVFAPSFGPNGDLFYVSDTTDWWNVYRLGKDGVHVNVTPRNEETAGPHWQFGNESYVIDPRGGEQMVVLCNSKLELYNLSTGKSEVVNSGYSSHSNLCLSPTGHAYCDAGASDKRTAIIRVDITSKKVDVIRESNDPVIDPGYLTVPNRVSWQSSETALAHGYFYPPTNKDYRAVEGTLPPLLVKVHGGPTACATTRFTPTFQYFTSRGFAVLDVNHRGSTGFGRKYRDLLKGNWGLFDIQDCRSGVLYLTEQGLVDPSKVCISGGSAGGYTTLACLTFTDAFKAGVSCYGVADLQILTEDCHKFESRYLDGLIAPVTEEGIRIYKERSPIWHIDKLTSPICFFHGTDDKIVPPNQAEMMYKSVKERKIPTALCMFEGEQHGFRKDENIRKALDGEFYFYARVFGFEPADKDIVTLEIDNLEYIKS